MISDTLKQLIRNPETPAYVIRDAVNEEDPPVASVWVVRGGAHDGDIYEEWFVAAYLEREAADALVAQLNDWCRAQKVNPARNRYVPFTNRPSECPLDSQFRCHGYGVSYDVEELELRA